MRIGCWRAAGHVHPIVDTIGIDPTEQTKRRVQNYSRKARCVRDEPTSAGEVAVTLAPLRVQFIYFRVYEFRTVARICADQAQFCRRVVALQDVRKGAGSATRKDGCAPEVERLNPNDLGRSGQGYLRAPDEFGSGSFRDRRAAMPAFGAVGEDGIDAFAETSTVV